MKKKKKLIISAGIVLVVLCAILLIIINKNKKYTFNSVLRKCGFGAYIRGFYNGEPNYYPNSWGKAVKDKNEDTLFNGYVVRDEKKKQTSASIVIQKDEHKFCNCTFYIFSSESEAKEAFEDCPNQLGEIYESGSDYIYGSTKLLDAKQNSFFYLTRNMLIKCNDFEPFAGWLDLTDEEYEQWKEENYSEKAVKTRKEKNKKKHKKIMRNW